MKSILLSITLFFSVILSAQKKSIQDVEKNRITANIYAILIDGQNDFENFKGDLISTNNEVTTYKVKNQNDAAKNFFTSTIKLNKAVYNMLKFESDDEKGEFFFRTVEQAFETLVNENGLIKKELRFPAGTETKATTYYSVDGISPVAYIWYKSTDPVLRYFIWIFANKKAVNFVQNYVTVNKISIAKPINSIAKTTSKPVKNNSEQKPISDLESVSNFLDSISIEKIKKETQPQFPTSHLQPNYIADQEDTSSLDGKDAVRSQNGYDDYVDLRSKAMILTLGLGLTKEVNLEKALALSNEAIRIFPNLSGAYKNRGQVNYKLGNATASQNDFDKAKQLAPFYSKDIDEAQAKIQGKVYLEASDNHRAPTVLYNSTNSESQQEELKKQNAQAQRTAKCICCMGTGQKEIKGMYLGSKTYSVTPVNGLGISHNETVAQYGPSRYVPCDCCR